MCTHVQARNAIATDQQSDDVSYASTPLQIQPRSPQIACYAEWNSTEKKRLRDGKQDKHSTATKKKKSCSYLTQGLQQQKPDGIYVATNRESVLSSQVAP